MRTNFIQKFYDPLTLGAGLAAAQGVLGLIQSIGGNQRAKRLLGQRQAYQTPQEYMKILQASQSRAQQGFDAFSLNYMTGQTDRAFSSTLGSATRLGADPNQLSAIFDQKMQGLMKIGAENQRLNMENFSKFIQATELIAQNKTAEWQSRENKLKDELQTAGEDKKDGLQNIFNAANAFISTQASGKTMDLFTELKKLLGGGGSSVMAPVTTPNTSWSFSNQLPDQTGSSPNQNWGTGG